jgi:hypothetical protein
MILPNSGMLAQVIQYIEPSEQNLLLSDEVRIPCLGAGVTIGRTFEIQFVLDL